MNAHSFITARASCRLVGVGRLKLEPELRSQPDTPNRSGSIKVDIVQSKETS
jgi:hypothetical protein